MTTNIQNVPETIIDKIHKLLELSKSNYIEESDSALCKAKELATRYSIDISRIPSNEIKNEPIIEENGISLGKRKAITQKLISWILQNHFNVRVLYQGNRYCGRSMCLIGTKSDIEMAKFVNSFLKEAFMDRWHKYYNETNCELKLRESFIFGLYQGLDFKLTEAKKKTETNVFEEIKVSDGQVKSEETKNNWAVAVINKAKQLDQAVKEFYPNVRKAYSASRSYRSDAIEDGRAVGKQINIARPINYRAQTQIS